MKANNLHVKVSTIDSFQGIAIVFIYYNSRFFFNRIWKKHITWCYNSIGRFWKTNWIFWNTKWSIYYYYIFTMLLFRHHSKFSRWSISQARNAKVSFNNCHFENNKAKSFSGALYIDFKLDTKINSCTFISNMGGDGQHRSKIWKKQWSKIQ